MLPPKQTPCRECPFRRKSLAGYLGTAEPAEFIAMATRGEEPMPCHMAVDYDDKDWEEQLPSVPQCAGRAIYLGNICKLPRNKQVATLEPDRKLIFGRPDEMLNHHGGDLDSFTHTMIFGKPLPKERPRGKS